ncbi:MAG TPA: hypothetical protein PKM33_13870, partial [Mycobacterium sp.]|nr:hypothetical protein [Mycobacterium sp.]
VDPDRAETVEPAQPPVKGLGIAAGARRPGAKKAPAPAPAAAAEATPASTEVTPEPRPEPVADAGNGQAEVPPVKGLGIAKGARPPGKKA